MCPCTELSTVSEINYFIKGKKRKKDKVAEDVFSPLSFRDFLATSKETPRYDSDTPPR